MHRKIEMELIKKKTNMKNGQRAAIEIVYSRIF